MTTREEALSLMQRAQMATSNIQEHARKAANLLKRSQYIYESGVNGLGVFLDPRQRKEDLIAARIEIDSALEKFKITTWPTDSDYDASGLWPCSRPR